MKTKGNLIKLILVIISALVIALPMYTYAQRVIDKHQDHDRQQKNYKHGDEHRSRSSNYKGRQHVYRVDKDYRRVTFKDKDYYIHGDGFYEMTHEKYAVIKPPIGFRISFLPRGYRLVRYKRIRYYVFGGVYFRFVPKERVYISVNAPF